MAMRPRHGRTRDSPHWGLRRHRRLMPFGSPSWPCRTSTHQTAISWARCSARYWPPKLHLTTYAFPQARRHFSPSSWRCSGRPSVFTHVTGGALVPKFTMPSQAGRLNPVSPSAMSYGMGWLQRLGLQRTPGPREHWTRFSLRGETEDCLSPSPVTPEKSQLCFGSSVIGPLTLTPVLSSQFLWRLRLLLSSPPKQLLRGGQQARIVYRHQWLQPRLVVYVHRPQPR